MDKKNNIPELLNDKQYWKSTVGAVEDVLPPSYMGEVLELLEQQGIEATNQEVSNVKIGRNRSNRRIAKAIFEVGQRYLEKEKVA